MKQSTKNTNTKKSPTKSQKFSKSKRPSIYSYGMMALFALLGIAFFGANMMSSRAITNAAAKTKVTKSAQTAGATSVLDPKYGLTGNAANDPDDTAAFGSAINDALASSVRYPAGPSGAPQAVVYVPAGSYRLNGLIIPSNVRLEVDAGAVLMPIVKPNYTLSAVDPIQLIQFGTHDKTNQVTNVSLVGINNATNSLKQRAGATYNNWDISGYFTADLDANDSGASNDYALVTLINVKDFLISNVYVVQNGTIPSCTATTSATCPVNRGPYPSPTSSRAAIVYKPSNQSSLAPGPYYDPTNGTLSNVYAIGGPYGFGATQISAGHNLTFSRLYSNGGTTLRLETDDTSKYYGAELKTLYADTIVGQNCNRPVSMAAHKQANSDVHITNVTALSCNNGLVESADNANNSGTFLNSTVDKINIIGGTSAQVQADNNTGGLWVIGTATKPVDVHPGQLSWSANVTNFSCSGTFTSRSDPFTVNGVARQVPACSK